MKQRDSSLDLMRFIGVLSIMMAHAGPPEWLFQLRNFATPLLIITSALTYGVVYKTRTLDALSFIKKRLSRLIFPAWIFLAFFFGFFFLATRITGDANPFTLRSIAATFTFYGGIGFVWIFKVYIILALITPAALKLSHRITSLRLYYLFLATAYLLYEILLRIGQPLVPDALAVFFRVVVFTIPPYALLYLYGLRLGELSSRSIGIISMLFLLTFLFLALRLMQETGHFVPTEEYKRPPRLYYLSYAMVWTNSIYLLCRHVVAHRVHWIEWISTHSLWIYLWHIFAVYLLEFTLGLPQGNLLACLATTAYLFGFGMLACRMQRRAVGKYRVKSKYTFVQRLAELLS